MSTKTAKKTEEISWNRTKESVWEVNNKLREAEEAVDAKREELKSAERMLEFVRAKVQAAAAAIGKAVKSAIDVQPYDGELIRLLESVADFGKLKDAPRSDEEIRKKLGATWSKYGSSREGETSGRGGGNPAVWIRAKGYNDKPTLEGPKLIAEVRRVLGIPLPAKAVVKTAAKPKAKKKSAKQVKFVTVPTTHAKTTAKKPAAGVAFRAQTYGQWLATVRGSLGKELGNKLDQEDQKLKKMYEEKLRPSDAAKKLRSDQAVDGFVEKMPAKKPPAPSPVVGADEGYDGGLAVEIEGGQTYRPDDLKVAPTTLSDSLDNTRIMPRPPKFEERDTIGRIGATIPIDGHHYCVFLANEKPGKTIYHLRRLAPKGGPDFFAWQREGMVIEGAVTRWESWNGDADKVPLAGVIVRSPDRGEWVLGFDEDVFYVEVEKVAPPDSKPEGMIDMVGGFDHVSVPKTKEFGAKLTVDVAVISGPEGDRFAAGYTLTPDGRPSTSREPGATAYSNRAAAILDGCEQLIELLRFRENNGTSPDEIRRATGLIRAVMAFKEQVRKEISAPPAPPAAAGNGLPKKSKSKLGGAAAAAGGGAPAGDKLSITPR